MASRIKVFFRQYGLRMALVALVILNISLFGLALRPEAAPGGSEKPKLKRTTDRHYEEWQLERVPEPSGVVYHPGTESIFVVGDEGDIAELTTDGKVLRTERIGGDLEGITVDPVSGMLYAVREGEDVIIEIRPKDFEILRRFVIDRRFGNEPEVIHRGGDGIEGISFIADSDNPEGGRIFAVNQFDPPMLIELALPLKSSTLENEIAHVVSAVKVSRSPLSDLYWMADEDAFLVTSALWRAVYVIDKSGKILNAVEVPGIMQEGITPLPDGSFVIVQDTGGLLKWKPSTFPFRLESKASAANDGSETKEKNE